MKSQTRIDLTKKKILVTGGAGFLGKHVVEKLKEVGVPADNITITRSRHNDLRNLADCYRASIGKDVIIHLAGNVGGIGHNREHPADLFDDNLIMGINVMK